MSTSQECDRSKHESPRTLPMETTIRCSASGLMLAREKSAKLFVLLLAAYTLM